MSKTEYTERSIQKALLRDIKRYSAQSICITCSNLPILRKYHSITGLQNFGYQVDNIFKIEDDLREFIELDFVQYHFTLDRITAYEIKCTKMDYHGDEKYSIYQNFCDALYFVVPCELNINPEEHKLNKPGTGLVEISKIYRTTNAATVLSADINETSINRHDYLKAILQYGKHIQI